MIADVIMFNGEDDMLELRLRALDGLVDRHVITEATMTHTGHGKELAYPQIADRFAKWADRITYVPVESVPGSQDPWAREHYQRDQAMAALEGSAPDSLVLICDVDEIPSRAALENPPEWCAVTSMRMAMYAVDWLYPEPHLTSVIARWWHVQAVGSLAKVRDGRYVLPVIEDGGWHLTWLGGVEAQRAKLGTSCHLAQHHAAGKMTEYEASLIRKGRCYREGIHHSGRLRMIPADVDETWPGDPSRYPASWFRPREAA